MNFTQIQLMGKNEVKVMKVDIQALLKAIEEIENRIKIEKILQKVSSGCWYFLYFLERREKRRGYHKRR